MIYLLLVFTCLHVLFYLVLISGWRKISKSAATSEAALLSVVIPVRNEEKVIEKLLQCLEYQEYEKQNFEVIVVDDFSEDNTQAIVRRLQKELSINLRLILLEDTLKSGKKIALTKGVTNAKYDFIITTDADCMMGPYWLASYAACIEGSRFIAGPVALKGEGLFSNLQQIEFAGLIGFGAVTLSQENPSMCSGANLGFDKASFFEVGGYTNNLEIPSGDDEFLLFNIQKKFPGSVSFLKNKSAVVITKTHTRLFGFINQRIRWTSKWKHNKNLKLRLVAILFFLDYLVFLTALLWTFAGYFPVTFLVASLALRWLANYFFVRPIQHFLGGKTSPFSVLLIQIIYPFHVIFMGVNSIFGSYTWKGRRY